ncbi:MAG: hypothetical protein JXQ91_03390 [Vannielia sp.]|uniref:hypothetical protein n=1 Tax=Vannielia sp. TaxID=2813045 RepID=UPI003B8DCF95
MTHRNTFRIVTMAAGAALVLGAVSAEAASASRSGARAAPQDQVILARQRYTDVIATLEGDGYRVVKMSSTMLGRVKIVAQNRVHLREIVVSRSTGEIKHDVILKVFKLREGSAQVKRSTKKSVNVGVGGGGVSAGGGGGGGVSVGVGGDGGVSANVGGGGGVSASVGGSGGVSASVGGGGVSASVGGLGVSLGN